MTKSLLDPSQEMNAVPLKLLEVCSCLDKQLSQQFVPAQIFFPHQGGGVCRQAACENRCLGIGDAQTHRCGHVGFI